MTNEEMALHNEELLIQKVRDEYSKGNLLDAMALCQDFMGVDAKEAFNRVKMLCSDIERYVDKSAGLVEEGQW